MELDIIILILFHILNCLYRYYYKKVILLLKFKTWVCLPHIMVFVYIFVIYISFEGVSIYNYCEFCFIKLRIVNYIVSFGNYALTTQ